MCSCGGQIESGRVDYLVKHELPVICKSCSNKKTFKYVGHCVTESKSGDFIQVVKDKQTAKELRKGRRSGPIGLSIRISSYEAAAVETDPLIDKLEFYQDKKLDSVIADKKATAKKRRNFNYKAE